MELKKDFNLPQNIDKNVKTSDYNFLKKNELLITSIFYTLQGEGVYAGCPSVFIRLAGCNLGGKGVNGGGCNFCDTRFFFNEGKQMSFETILQEVNTKNIVKTDLIVITGGEPFLQQNIVEFVIFLNQNGYKTQFETNGTIFRNIPKEAYNKTNLVVCSPKMGASKVYSRLRSDLFERVDFLKFVVEKHGQFNYVPDYAFEFAKTKKVYVSPINVYKREVKCNEIPSFFTQGLYDIDICGQNYKYAAELCLKYSLTLSLQQHIFTEIE